MARLAVSKRSTLTSSSCSAAFPPTGAPPGASPRPGTPPWLASSAGNGSSPLEAMQRAGKGAQRRAAAAGRAAGQRTPAARPARDDSATHAAAGRACNARMAAEWALVSRVSVGRFGRSSVVVTGDPPAHTAARPRVAARAGVSGASTRARGTQHGVAKACSRKFQSARRLKRAEPFSRRCARREPQQECFASERRVCARRGRTQSAAGFLYR